MNWNEIARMRFYQLIVDVLDLIGPIASLSPLCAVLGSLCISRPMEMYGRRLTLVGTSVPFIVGFYLMGLSYYVNYTPLLYIGRVITGLVTGAATPPAQIYVSLIYTITLPRS